MKRCIIGMLLIGIGFYGGFFLANAIAVGDMYSFPSPDGSIEDLIDFHEYGISAHKYYSLHPEEQTYKTGDAKWNYEAMLYHKQALDILMEMEE